MIFFWEFESFQKMFSMIPMLQKLYQFQKVLNFIVVSWFWGEKQKVTIIRKEVLDPGFGGRRQGKQKKKQ